MKYSIDTSAILDAWVRYYPPLSFPGLWAKIDDLIEAGRLVASDEVLAELGKKSDEVGKWAKARPHLFLPSDVDVQTEVMGIMAAHPTLVDIARNRSTADPFVIAVARVHGCVVITGELSKPTKPKIPDVCLALGIDYTNILGLIVRERWTF